MTLSFRAWKLPLFVAITIAACRSGGRSGGDSGSDGSGAIDAGGLDSGGSLTGGSGGLGSGGSLTGGSGGLSTGGSGGTAGATMRDASALDTHDSGQPSDATAGDTGGSSCEGVDGGTSPRSQYLDMRVTALGFEEHEGRSVFLVTKRVNARVLGVARATIVGGGFSVHLPKGYLRAANQEIIWLVDTDNDGLCNEAAGDHTGFAIVDPFDPPGNEIFVTAITDNHVRTTPQYPDLCNPLKPFADLADFNITGSGFAAHEGRQVHLLTRTSSNGAIFGAGTAPVVSGNFSFSFPEAFESFSYQEIFWFVDDDGDGRCTLAGDHTGFLATSAFMALDNKPVTMPITDNHTSLSARGADVCVVMNGCQLAP